MPVGTSLNGTTVLVADDDPDSVEILQYLIGTQDGTVRAASSAHEALELLLTCTPHVLLLDISMPDMDGCQLLEAIRGVSRLRAIPAVAVTAHAYERDKVRCLEAGFARHIAKPYEPDDLLQVVAHLASFAA
jgi:CheY-like chemotaxis protein